MSGALKEAEERAMHVFWEFSQEFRDAKGKIPISVILAVYLVGLKDGARISKAGG